MWKSLVYRRTAIAVAASLSIANGFRNPVLSDRHDEKSTSQQPSYLSVPAAKRGMGKKTNKDAISLDSMVMITGSAHVELSEEISKLIGVPLANAALSRFADGEVSIQINENLRGKDVFIIQSCAAPVNDSIVELLLTVSCARYNASALTVDHLIPV